MSQLLPRFYTTEWLGCFAEGERSGWSLCVEWRSFYIEIVMARQSS